MPAAELAAWIAIAIVTVCFVGMVVALISMER